ncbi:MAG: type II toxin-antitoxin system VapC family toxin [Verrucomicrobiota bacterium]
MKLLLDTCSLIWILSEPQKLSARARQSLVDPTNSIHVSAVSFWEISLKNSIGKLKLQGIRPENFPEIVAQEDWQIHPLEAHTASSVHNLPKINTHKDPFDRMLIHLAITEDYYFVSKDKAINAYATHGLKVCW